MLTRNKEAISKLVYEKDGVIYTKDTLTIEFPKWYEDDELMILGNINYLYGVFAIISGNNYAVSLIPTLVETSPLEISEVDRGDEIYTQFIYGKDSAIIDTTTVLKKKLLTWNLYNNFFLHSYIPWFLEYEDLIKLADNLTKYAGNPIGDKASANELIVSYISRCKNNKTMFYRQNTKDDITYVDLLNVYYSAISPVNKIAGGYFKQGLISAIVDEPKEPTKLEQIVRK